VLVCRETDPAWTPLFTIAAAVVTETGGVLSHAAIVAREVGIPAVLAVPGAAEALIRVAAVTVDGDAGRVDATSGP
jgi:pyruvate,water dikinase